MNKKVEDELSKSFKTMIKDAMVEEGVFKEKDVKQLMKDILKEMDLLIANRVKQHFYEIGLHMVKNGKPNQPKKSGDINNA
jgi:hypothetical protein